MQKSQLAAAIIRRIIPSFLWEKNSEQLSLHIVRKFNLEIIRMSKVGFSNNVRVITSKYLYGLVDECYMNKVLIIVVRFLNKRSKLRYFFYKVNDKIMII